MEPEYADTCFTGSYEHTLDPKGRVSLPAKFRRNLPETVKTVLSLDCSAIYVFSPQAYNSWVKSFFPEGFNPRSSSEVDLHRRLLAFAEDADIDSVGRIGISARLRSFVKLEKDVTIIGDGDHIEIVDRAEFNELETKLLAMNFMEE